MQISKKKEEKHQRVAKKAASESKHRSWGAPEILALDFALKP